MKNYVERCYNFFDKGFPGGDMHSVFFCFKVLRV